MTVFRWDIDKTYLQTNFETVSGLVKAATQEAKDKETIRGAISLVKALNKDKDSSLVFISGSPKQMRRVLLKKFELDGISVDQIILKDSLGSIKRGQLRDITNQFGYKLSALIKDRLNYSAIEPEYLFGDSAEADAYIYATYAMVLSQQISRNELRILMKKAGAYQASIDAIERYLLRLGYGGAVQKIFIRLVNGQPRPQFRQLFPLVIPVHYWSQASMVLFEAGVIDAQSVHSVLLEEGWEAKEAANLVQNTQRQSFINEETATFLYEQLGVYRPILPCIQEHKTLSFDSIKKAMEGEC